MGDRNISRHKDLHFITLLEETSPKKWQLFTAVFQKLTLTNANTIQCTTNVFNLDSEIDKTLTFGPDFTYLSSKLSVETYSVLILIFFPLKRIYFKILLRKFFGFG